MGLLEHLERHYQAAGCRVYSKHSTRLPAAPPRWQGVLPDMIIDKGGKRTALFCESGSTLSEPGRVEQWREATKNEGVRLHLFLYQKSDQRTVKEMLEAAGLEAEVSVVTRESYYKRRWHLSPRMVVIWILISIATLFLLWFGSLLYKYNPISYEPRDLERQQQLEKMK